MSFFPSKRKPFIFLVFPIILLGISQVFPIIILMNAWYGSMILLGLLILSIIMLLISLLYGIYPLFIKSEKFFTRREYSNITLEFEFIKKFLLIIIIIITILNIYYLFDPEIITLEHRDKTNSKTSLEKLEKDYYNLTKDRSGGGLYSTPEPIQQAGTNPFYEINYIFLIQAYLGLIAFAAFLRIITYLVKKEFRIYYAKGCCKIISEKIDEFDKIKFLSLMLNSYNKYLKRNLQLEINNITKIYSIICYKDPKERNQIIKSVCDCLNIEDDKLNLSKYLSTIYEIPNSDFFIKRSILSDFKMIGAILATAIPIIISLIPILTTIMEE